jgi:dienelactone hydrolase
MEAIRHAAAAEWVGNRSRTAAMREILHESLAYRPKPVPLNPRVLREEKFDDYTRRTIRVQINPDDETVGAIYLPRGASSRNNVPALLGLHEHGGQWLLGHEKLCDMSGLARTFREYQNRCYGGQSPAEYFARNGFAVLVVDQLCFGSRALWKPGENRAAILAKASPKQDLNLRLRMRYDQNAHHRAFLANGVTESEITLYDHRRSLDFLTSLPEIDAKRIGCFGLSVGSMHTHYLAAFDARIKAAIPVCWAGDWRMMIDRDGPRVLGTQFLYPRINAHAHIPELIALSDPAAVLVINGKQDSMYSMAMQEKTRKEVLAYAKKQGRTKTARWHYFDGPHCFHPPQQAVALNFFREFL